MRAEKLNPRNRMICSRPGAEISIRGFCRKKQHGSERFDREIGGCPMVWPPFLEAFIDPLPFFAPQKTWHGSCEIQQPQWHTTRIDFQSWPYPSATKLIVNAMNETVVGGDPTFLKKLDPVIIGVIGFMLDFICEQAIRRASWIREE